MRSAGIIALMWAGYTIGLYGYTLIKGYNVNVRQLASPTEKWGAGKTVAQNMWPPPLAPTSVIIPSGSVIAGIGSLGPVSPSSNTAPGGGVQQA